MNLVFKCFIIKVILFNCLMIKIILGYINNLNQDFCLLFEKIGIYAVQIFCNLLAL